MSDQINNTRFVKALIPIVASAYLGAQMNEWFKPSLKETFKVSTVKEITDKI